MTAKELIANLHFSGSIDPAECFLYLAAHAHEARLAGGQRLLDQSDFTAWLIELAQALRQRATSNGEKRVDRTCPRCGHIHEGDRECGAWLGAGRFYPVRTGGAGMSAILFGQILGAISAVIFLALLVALIRDAGYKAGVKDGYAIGYGAGKRDEGNWWLELEHDTLQVREKIWREEAQR